MCWVHTCLGHTCPCRAQRRISGVLLYHSPPYTIERRSLRAGNPDSFSQYWPFLTFNTDVKNLKTSPYAYSASTLIYWVIYLTWRVFLVQLKKNNDVQYPWESIFLVTFNDAFGNRYYPFPVRSPTTYHGSQSPLDHWFPICWSNPPFTNTRSHPSLSFCRAFSRLPHVILGQTKYSMWIFFKSSLEDSSNSRFNYTW